MSDRRRNARSLWHDEALQMKRDGFPLQEIADKLGRHISSVNMATRGVPAKHGARRNKGVAAGFKMGTKKRVAVSFSDSQVVAVNKIASEQGVSFSLAVSRLVDAALLGSSFTDMLKTTSKPLEVV